MTKLPQILNALVNLDLWCQPGDIVKIYLTIVAKSEEGVFKGGITRLMGLIHHPLAGIDEESPMHAAAIRKARRELMETVNLLVAIRSIDVESQVSWRVLELGRLDADIRDHVRRQNNRRSSNASYKRRMEREALVVDAEIALMEKAEVQKEKTLIGEQNHTTEEQNPVMEEQTA